VSLSAPRKVNKLCLAVLRITTTARKASTAAEVILLPECSSFDEECCFLNEESSYHKQESSTLKEKSSI
jgi:hypothetical protein